ncbi:MAG: helix-turn-helix transcriptional regulator [Planctomycetes bacterium]|nr:helix-turn-helix transcriptional regulator [Planctomycetota bacterium]
MEFLRLHRPRASSLIVSKAIQLVSEPFASIGPRVCAWYELHYVIEGELSCDVDGEAHTLGPGNLLACWPRQRLTLTHWNKRRSLTYFHCHFACHDAAVRRFPDTADGKAALRQDIDDVGPRSVYLPQRLAIDDGAALTEGFTRLMAHQRSDGPGSEISAEAQMQVLLQAISRQVLANALHVGERRHPGVRDVKVARGIEYIARNLHLALSLHDVAAHVRCNSQYFARIFKASTGSSVGAYIRRRKMAVARQALLASGMTAATVAASVGYRDPLFFSRQFKIEVGVSPRDYVAMNRR